MAKENKEYFWDLGLSAIKQLETDQGILASSRTEAYACIFGRDSAISALKILRAYKKTKDPYFLEVVRKILINLAVLQGRKENIESGEQPGKAIHEYRPEKHERLTKKLNPPWYVYEDDKMRNYDSVDSTPLFLICVYRYWQLSNDERFMEILMPNIRMGLDWIMEYSDSNGDGFVDYELSPKRVHGGLVTQNWMDSTESVFHETGGVLVYPMAPVEVQAYVYLTYRLWSNYFKTREPALAEKFDQKAINLKELFNKKFPAVDPDGNYYLVSKLDGEGKQFRSVRSDMGHTLWASLNMEDDGTVDSIVYAEDIPKIVKRLVMPDIFEPDAGIRTLSKLSVNFQPNSYHNGSIWPHDNAMIAEGFEVHGFLKEAKKIKAAVLKAIKHFKTPIELFVYIDGKYSEYISENGSRACMIQAWTAASLLDFTANYSRAKVKT
ncbi:MAG TPA: amylo-alpha-1,6-glucosidase [Verrucomicrobiae bacterium]|nr:amylo-alpha-1,6-glucosidase [Verrucomicrobiae bacterium]